MAKKKEVSPVVAAIVIIVIVVIIVAVYFAVLSPKKPKETGQVNPEAKAKMEAAKQGSFSGFMPPEMQRKGAGSGGPGPGGGGVPPMPPEMKGGGQ